MIQNGILNVSFRPISEEMPIIVHVAIYHQKGPKGIEIFDTPSKEELNQQITSYIRRAQEE